MHEVPNFARVTDDRVTTAEGLSYEVRRCSRQQDATFAASNANGGYVEWFKAQTFGPKYRFIQATWVVPDYPQISYGDAAGDQGKYYAFPGLDRQGIILQPVLTYGRVVLPGDTSVAGREPYGGAKFTIASWRCGGNTGENCYHSPAIQVYPGDTILGTVRFLSCDTPHTCIVRVTTHDRSRGTTTVLELGNEHDEYVIAVAAVEAYDLSQCGMFPPRGVRYSDVKVETSAGPISSPGWGAAGPDTFTGIAAGGTCDYGLEKIDDQNLVLKHGGPGAPVPGHVTSPTAYIDGPYEVEPYESPTWSAVVQNAYAPIEYRWYFDGELRSTSVSLSVTGFLPHAQHDVVLEIFDVTGGTTRTAPLVVLARGYTECDGCLETARRKRMPPKMTGSLSRATLPPPIRARSQHRP